jgi:hypothetical protein
MAKSLMISVDANNEIVTFGEDFAGGILVETYPADFWKYSNSKYKWNGSQLVKRESWVNDPTDAEWDSPYGNHPSAPETPADPE